MINYLRSRISEPLAFPPPYRAMLSINSDVEWTSFETFLDTVRIFETRGLECSFSAWMFGDPEVTWRLFDENGEFSAEAELAAEFMRSGIIDTLHSFTGVQAGKGAIFGRDDISRAFEKLKSRGLGFTVYTNHGSVDDTQNIGPAGQAYYQEGDLPGAERYHLDLTIAQGAEFFWTDADLHLDAAFRTKESGERGLFETQISRDGNPILRFKRYMGPVALGPWPGCIVEQLQPILDQEASGYLVVYQHLGVDRTPEGRPFQLKPPYFSVDGLQTLNRLASSQANGSILMSTTERLLRHARMMRLKPWRIKHGLSGNIEVSFNHTVKFDDVSVEFSWKDFAGWTMRALPGSKNYAFLNGERRLLENWIIDGKHYTGFKWHRIDVSPILGRLNRNLIQHSVDDSHWKNAIEIAGVSESIISFGAYQTERGIDYYRDRLARLGFSGGRVLDAGCGVGSWTLALAERFNEVVALDQDPGMVAIVEGTCRNFAENVKICNAPVTEIPFGDDTFDAIWCAGVFYVTDYQKTLVEFNRVMKPGGRVYISFNSLDWWIHMIENMGVIDPSCIIKSCETLLNFTCRLANENNLAGHLVSEYDSSVLSLLDDNIQLEPQDFAVQLTNQFNNFDDLDIFVKSAALVRKHGNDSQRTRLREILSAIFKQKIVRYEIVSQSHCFQADQIVAILTQEGFIIIDVGSEGGIVIDSSTEPVNPIYPAEYGVLEVLADKAY